MAGPGSRRLARAGVLAALLLTVAAAVTPTAVAAASAAGDWPQFGRTAQHPNTNPAETAFAPGNVGGPAIAWTGQLGEADETEAGQVVAGGSVYVTGFDGNLSMFDDAGWGASAYKPRWQGHTGNDITSSAAVLDGLALVGSADHLLYAFDVRGCGKPICQPRAFVQLSPSQSYQGSSIAVSGGKVLLNSTDNTPTPDAPAQTNLYVLALAGT
jgi:hypothetical protein